MKTLIEGNMNKKEKLKYFECEECGWVGTATKDEYQSMQQYNETYYYVVCPFCNKDANEVLNEEKLKKYKKLKEMADKNILRFPELTRSYFNPENVSIGFLNHSILGNMDNTPLNVAWKNNSGD